MNVIVWYCTVITVYSQSPLFVDHDPLNIKLGYSFKKIRNTTADSVYFDTKLHYQKLDNEWDSLKAEVRGRGNFRRKYCTFTPIRLKIKKKESEGTLFSEDKNLKLVLPCQDTKGYDQYIYREFLCYKILESIYPYHFKTRLLNVELTDSNKKSKIYQLNGILIEDNDKVAARHNGIIIDNPKLHPALFIDTLIALHDFFQFMIGNTDWSSSAGHNSSVMKPKGKPYIALPYDFDMSGLVNAPYATVNDDLKITNVTERLYRGYCVSDSIFRIVRDYYLSKESKIRDVIRSYEHLFNLKEYNALVKYIDDFFNILNKENDFKASILTACRTY